MNNSKLKRIFLSPPHMSGEEIKFVQEAFASNYIAPAGPQIDAFEREFCKITGMPYAVAVSSGTAAIHLALHILGTGRNDIVIASALTFIGSVSPAVFLGAAPVFIDSDPLSWNMDTGLLADELESLSKQGTLPKAVIPTDLYGQCVDIDRILKVCEPYGVPVVIDSAESLGATYKGKGAGTGAKASVYSFNGNKIITTSGGGMLASDDKKLVEQARFLSQQAKDNAPHYEHSQIGYNYRMSNVLAAIGRGQLSILEKRIEKKRWILNRYKEMLEDISGIDFKPEMDYGRSNCWLTVILITPDKFGADSEKIRITLEKENIESRPVWKPMHMQPVFKGCKIRGGKVSEDLFQRGLCLPSGTQMTEKDIGRIAEIIKSCADKN